MNTEKHILLGLVETNGLGPARIARLKQEFGSYQSAWEADPLRLEQILGSEVAGNLINNRKNLRLEQIAERYQREGINLIAEFEPEYPGILRNIHCPPVMLFSRGRLENLFGMAIAIVGARKASAYGRKVARELGRSLGKSGLIVISGMARGIDAESHWGGLEAGGKTIGVLGNGLDVVYPRENIKLYQAIEAEGLLITEFPLGTPPESRNFPIRNRIISGLSRGVVVVEALIKSGAMITVGFALEQGRDVFAVPGPVSSPLSAGPHSLIKDGACLLESAGDVFREWGLQGEIEAQPILFDDSKDSLLDCIGFEPVHIDYLLEVTGFSHGQLAARLLQFEIEGRIKSLPGKRFIRL